MRIKSLPENERPLEKARTNGIEFLSSSELLALILHTGTPGRSALELAGDVLSHLEDGLYDLGWMGFDELMEIHGIGAGKAGSILAAVELGKRLSASRQPERNQILSAAEVSDLFMEKLRYEKKEHFITLLLNTKGEILQTEDVSVGELTGTLVHPREVFQKAIRRSAASVIFIHNHPSGDPTPSNEDYQTTERLVHAGKILGISVLDHIIIGDGTYTSLRGMEKL